MRGKDNNNTTTPASARPYASEAEIRAMYDNAAVHSARAAQHEQAAAQIVQAAKTATSEVVDQAQSQAAAYVAKAEETAAEMVRKAREQADGDVHEALQRAAAEMQAAEGQAAMIRTDRDAETKRERFWASLAAEEAERADLQPLAVTLTDGQLGTGEVAQP